MHIYSFSFLFLFTKTCQSNCQNFNYFNIPVILYLCASRWNNKKCFNLGYVKSSNIVLGLVTKIVNSFILTSLLDFLSKYDYFHIHMDFVTLYRSTE